MRLDRAGIFKAKPTSWGVQKSEGSQSVAIAIDFTILAQLEGYEWADWSGYEEHTITGYFWVIKKDGSINSTTVTSICESLYWNCSLESIANDPVPDMVVQITVKEETYNGQTRLKVGWLNPGDYSPKAAYAPVEEVKELQTRFGSLLRAAGGSSVPKTKAPF